VPVVAAPSHCGKAPVVVALNRFGTVPVVAVPNHSPRSSRHRCAP